MGFGDSNDSRLISESNDPYLIQATTMVQDREPNHAQNWTFRRRKASSSEDIRVPHNTCLTRRIQDAFRDYRESAKTNLLHLQQREENGIHIHHGKRNAFHKIYRQLIPRLPDTEVQANDTCANIGRPIHHSLPVVVLGGKGVGKTALIVRGLTKRFLTEYQQTSEQRYRFAEASERCGKEIVLVDSDGQNESLIRRASAVIVVYSVTSPSSFVEAKHTLEVLNSMKWTLQRRPHILLLANKIDINDQRFVTEFEGRMAALHHGADYCELSVAQEVQKVTETLLTVCDKITTPVTTQRTSSTKASSDRSKTVRLVRSRSFTIL